jgi:hypothetical protein
MLRKIKNEIRVIGWDDGPFEHGKKDKIPLVGVVFRGGIWQDGILVREIDIDGFDATDVIADATKKTKHRGQLRIIMLDGISFGGFNMVDIRALHEETGLPVIAVTRKKTNFELFKQAMLSLPKFELRWRAVENAGELYSVQVHRGTLYFQKAGLSQEQARRVIKVTATRSILPEPIRVAHMNASAIVRGESIGRP